jgi:hypothetical protein
MIDAKVESRWRPSETRGTHGGRPSAHRNSTAPRTVPHRPTPPPSPQFLIANPRLEFRVSHSEQSPGPISNRERIAIFQLDFSAAQAGLTSTFQGVGALACPEERRAPTYNTEKCRGFSPWGNSPPPCIRASLPPHLPQLPLLAAHATILVHTPR